MTPEANKIAELEAALKASQAREEAYRADVVRLTAKVTVLAAEVRTKRALLDDVDRDRMSWAKIIADDKAESATDAAGALT